MTKFSYPKKQVWASKSGTLEVVDFSKRKVKEYELKKEWEGAEVVGTLENPEEYYKGNGFKLIAEKRKVVKLK